MSNQHAHKVCAPVVQICMPALRSPSSKNARLALSAYGMVDLPVALRLRRLDFFQLCERNCGFFSPAKLPESGKQHAHGKPMGADPH